MIHLIIVKFGHIYNKIELKMSKLKIFIAGHNGMVGSALIRNLKTHNVEIITKEKRT